MNILVTLDDNYVNPLLVMLRSLFKKNKCFKIVVYVAYHTLNQENKKKIRNLILKLGGNCRLIYLDGKKMIPLNTSGHITLSTYIRLFIPQLLPKTIHKILYLDPDMLICKQLDSLYNSDINDCCYAACPDIQGNKIGFPSRRDIKLNSNSIYFNAGVLLMNLDKLRSDETRQNLTMYLSTNRTFRYHDQDIINYLYKKEIKPLACGYNYSARRGDDSYDKLIQAARRYCVKRPRYIIHYLGPEKPWKKSYSERFLFVYLLNAIPVTDKKFLKIIISNFANNILLLGKTKGQKD